MDGLPKLRRKRQSARGGRACVERPTAGSCVVPLDPPLPAKILRLLVALAEPGAFAAPDPTDDGAVVIGVSAGGPSLSRGRHAAASLAELARRDLVVAAVDPGRERRVTISQAGRAFLRRRATPGDTPFAGQHAELHAVQAPDREGAERVTVNAAESPLDWLSRRKGPGGAPLIDPVQREAGERLRRDLTFAGMLPSVTARWDGIAAGRGQGGASRDPAGATDAVIAARQRVRQALDAVGPDFAGLLVDLCGFLKGLEQIERDRRWPPRSAKVVLGLALGRLADHYGYEREARGVATSRMRAWPG
jgi:hypothetical protein